MLIMTKHTSEIVARSHDNKYDRADDGKWRNTLVNITLCNIAMKSVLWKSNKKHVAFEECNMPHLFWRNGNGT
eukprot:1897469-Amphidinium_carterae.1